MWAAIHNHRSWFVLIATTLFILCVIHLCTGDTDIGASEGWLSTSIFYAIEVAENKHLRGEIE